MALYQDGILISGANQLPQMTMAEYLAISASDRPTYWICTDRDYDDLSADNVTYGSGSVADALDEKVSKSGDTMSGHLTIDLHDGGADQSNTWSSVALGNNISKGTAGHSAGYVRFFGHGSNYTDLSAPNATNNRDIVLPDKNGTVALTSDIDDVVTRSNRANVSVLTYAASLSEGIHFYTTSANTADNPSYGSHMFMIFRASTGITIFGMPLASRDAYINASNNSGSTWGGWKSFTFS